MDSYRFILSGGGTGGHIYPALAIANELKRRFPKSEFLFVGAKDRMEMEKVPQAGYNIEGLWISGLQRKLTLKNMMFPVKLISSLIKARNIVNRFRPHLVVGTGGFASGPLLQVASAKGIPCVLQEQNSYAGITNRLLRNKVEKICVAYDGMEKFFPGHKILKTGNPVRSGLANSNIAKAEALRFFGLQPGVPTLLVLGGSLGARRINQLIAEKRHFFQARGLQLLWQCGKGYIDQYAQYGSPSTKVLAYINDMDKAYAAADIIISRAGASAVSELCMVGKPTLFIPSPNVAEDHQTKNAMALVKENAAILVHETALEQRFETVFTEVMESKALRESLSANIKKLALPHATRDICNAIENILKR